MIFSVLLAILVTANCINAVVFPFIDVKENGSLSPVFLSLLKKEFNANSFVETGTLSGVTTTRAAKIFRNVYTIEFSRYYFENNKKLFQKFSNIKAFLGDSGKMLNNILPRLHDKKPIIFLDAHYSGGNTGKADTNTPLLNEISLIVKYCPEAVIIIDDLRFCQRHELVALQLSKESDKTVGGYPTVPELLALFLRKNPSYRFVVWGDAGFVYRGDLNSKIALSPVLEGMTKSRIFDELRLSSKDDTLNVIKAELLIMNAFGQEAIAIKNLLNVKGGLWKPELFTTHYNLWNALVSVKELNYAKAKQLLQKIQILGFNHWRINLYLSELSRLEGDLKSATYYRDMVKNELHAIGCDNEIFFR